MDDSQVYGPIVVLGAGGFGREVAWLARAAAPEAEVILAVSDRKFLPTKPSRSEVRLLDSVPSEAHFVVAVGDPGGRREGVTACLARGLRAATLVHPGIDLSGGHDIGAGSVLCSGVVLTTGIRLGDHVQLNLNTTVGHDSVLEEFVTTAPGVHISGNVHVESGAYLGTGAVVINGSPDAPLVIGENSVVAAGACVTKSVEAGALVAGVPAVRKR